MDGMHDLGGKQGFGFIQKEAQRAGLKENWEIKISALMGRLVGQHCFNMDEYRHAIERMAPAHYLSASYFERTFTAVASLCLEKGLITAEEFRRAAGEAVPLSVPSKPGRTHEGALPGLKIGDTVRVRNLFVPGHIRMPAYVRGKTGKIVGVSPAYPYPDAAAHGLDCARQATFDVCFQAGDLWENGSDSAEVHVGLFHAYLEKVEGCAAGM
ncbi:nitrile hydratase subunit beta [Bordetella petrii]|uniref:nitrile hydratase subunit beta n=1 Tax=Bordetella petrii TaxID=94624 RepID=UPI001E46AF8D|nr:nitrile hydratase subunit beta [Bordetella petrii]MCD0505866.1 nitrile hydratase subunit beta [Bordetella petrii]